VTGRTRIAPERPACAGDDARGFKLLARPLADDDDDARSFRMLARPQRAATLLRSQA
jgi:hypothetical protein